MPNKSERFDNFLNDYKFHANNVDFRIVSSKALEKFKNVQSFQLNQLVNGKFYFPQDRREVLLLKYELWTKWLLEVENLFIEKHEFNNMITQKDIDLVAELSQKSCDKYKEIVTDNLSDHFDQDFIKVWCEVHTVAYNFFKDYVRKMTGTYEEVFVNLVDVTCEFLMYTLTEIHELNEMFNNPESDEIFLVISDYCLRFFNITGKCIVALRAEIYSKTFPFKKVWFKNYTDQNLPAALIAQVSDAGFKIDYKRTIFGL